MELLNWMPAQGIPQSMLRAADFDFDIWVYFSGSWYSRRLEAKILIQRKA